MTGVRQTQDTQVFVIPECPSPRKAHPHYDPNEESPESQWLFGAGLGARSPQRTPRGKHSKANAVTQKRTYTAPPPPFPVFPFVLRRDRHKETHKPEVNQPSSITARQPENALPAISTHGGTGTEHPASRSVWRYTANSRRDRTQGISTGTYDRREPSTTARITHQGLYIHFELNSTARPCENAIIRLLAAHSHAERRASPHLQKSTSKQTYRKITRRD